MKKLKAFSILECLICLMLIGIFTSSVMQFYKTISYSYNLKITKIKANYIRKCVEGYVARHGFLPYAASKLDGYETDDCVIGYLPYKTLGISKSYACDGFGINFSFVVNENLVLKYHQKQNWKILPPFIPNIFVVNNSKHWNRLAVFYNYDGKKIENPQQVMNSYLYDYDDIQCDKNISIYNLNEAVKLSVIRVYPIILNSQITSYNEKFDAIENKRNSYLVSDIIAWALISKKFESQNVSLNIKNECFRIVFWQSRFNLAAQIKCPSNTMGTAIGFPKGIKFKN